jgi:hypothetical protein
MINIVKALQALCNGKTICITRENFLYLKSRLNAEQLRRYEEQILIHR